jgi:chemotaxis protein methyltransferase CheR
VFQLLRAIALPSLAAEADHLIRCWSAGCASGEEPYTLAIMWRLALQDRYPGVDLHVLATDAHEAVLDRARTACYPSSTLRELPDEWVETAFRPTADAGDDQLCLRRPFRDHVDLLRQDIRHQMPDGPFHLVLCRNVVFTYFDPALQARLLGDILARIVPGGFLVLGAHEDFPAGPAGPEGPAGPTGGWPLERVRAGEPVFRTLRPTTG